MTEPIGDSFCETLNPVIFVEILNFGMLGDKPCKHQKYPFSPRFACRFHAKRGLQFVFSQIFPEQTHQENFRQMAPSPLRGEGWDEGKRDENLRKAEHRDKKIPSPSPRRGEGRDNRKD